MIKTIHHYRPFTSNIGDLFVRDGIHDKLRRCFPEARILEFAANAPDSKSSAEVGLKGINFEKTNAEADLVVVGGSNMYQGPDWRFKTTVENMKALKPPMVFIGLGVGSVRGSHAKAITAESLLEIQESHRKARGVAVRDDETRRFLQTLGLASKMTGCPATFVGNDPLRFGPIKRVVISAPPARFLPKLGRRGWLGNFIMLQTFKSLLSLLQRQSIYIQIIAHDAKDMDYLNGLLPCYGLKAICLAEDTRAFYEIVKKADLSICYRLHMAIAGFGFGTPFILLDFDLRTRAFSQTYGAQQLTYNPFHFADSRRFLRVFKKTEKLAEKLPALFGPLVVKKQEYAERTEKFYNDLRNSLNG
jgi:polysaccharide pyruvyl transferase WcaK-like protein